MSGFLGWLTRTSFQKIEQLLNNVSAPITWGLSLQGKLQSKSMALFTNKCTEAYKKCFLHNRWPTYTKFLSWWGLTLLRFQYRRPPRDANNVTAAASGTKHPVRWSLVTPTVDLLAAGDPLGTCNVRDYLGRLHSMWGTGYCELRIHEIASIVSEAEVNSLDQWINNLKQIA